MELLSSASVSVSKILSDTLSLSELLSTVSAASVSEGEVPSVGIIKKDYVQRLLSTPAAISNDRTRAA